MDGGSSMEGNSICTVPRSAKMLQKCASLFYRALSSELLTSLLSSVKRTATPASTLPTVREISMMSSCVSFYDIVNGFGEQTLCQERGQFPSSPADEMLLGEQKDCL